MQHTAVHVEMRFRKAPSGRMMAYLAPAFTPSPISFDPAMRNYPKVSVDNDIRVFSEDELRDLEKSGRIPACSREILIMNSKPYDEDRVEVEENGDETMISGLDNKGEIIGVGIIRAKELSGDEPSPAGLPVITDMRESVPEQPFLLVHINGDWDENTWLNQMPDGSQARVETEESPSP